MYQENADVGMWGKITIFFETQLADDFAKTAFVDIWNEAMCFKLVGKLKPQSQVHEGFWTALGMSSTVSELMDRLGISDAEIIRRVIDLKSGNKAGITEKDGKSMRDGFCKFEKI